ncbi:hypothetical protein HYC85_019874 [Camellia sinensis]|uniref:SPARK domain-containing protein n=1 Tax=Camellia sinensis TaxID=4442 RepID=A0A7J7GN74_CAMSI|nr:hypothetical protein HYC85_019874 [Camellia sinensis]
MTNHLPKVCSQLGVFAIKSCFESLRIKLDQSALPNSSYSAEPKKCCDENHTGTCMNKKLEQFSVSASLSLLLGFPDIMALEIKPTANHISSTSELAIPPKSGLFEPIEISPAVIPHYPFPGESLPPMYPAFPPTYDPVLTGKCPINFSALSDIMDKTASDCSQPLAAFIGNVICCPQLSSLLHIFQGYYSTSSDKLVLQNVTANYCFSDIISILESRRANSSIPTICSVKSSNLTGGSCPVKDVTTFEKTVNASKLLEACSSVDPLKECCRPICQPAIMEAALKISAGQSLIRCLLRSLPTDLVFDNPAGVSFTCDLSDDIQAPWPLSSSLSSYVVLEPDMED